MIEQSRFQNYPDEILEERNANEWEAAPGHIFAALDQEDNKNLDAEVIECLRHPDEESVDTSDPDIVRLETLLRLYTLNNNLLDHRYI